MKILLTFLFLLAGFSALAQSSTNRITATITVTNSTFDNFAISVNGNTRVFTNTVTAAASQIATNDTVAGTASNLYYHILSSPFSGPINVLSFTNGASVVFLRGALGQAMSVTILSNWATVEYSTQVFSLGMTDVRVPMANEVSAVRIKVASELVTGINAYATNAFPTNSAVLANHLSTGPHPQSAANKVFSSSHITGSAVSNSTLVNIPSANVGTLIATSFTARAASITNGFFTNSPAILTTNLQVVGGAYLTNTTADGFSVTNLRAANLMRADAGILFNGTFTANYDVAENAFIIENIDAGIQAMRLEYGGNNIFVAPTVISNNLTSVSNFTAATSVFQGGSLSTNVATFGTNKIAARVDFTSRANSSLADGNNSGIVLGSNVYVRISGPSGAYTNAGFAAEQDGSFHILQFDNPANNMTILDNSGLDASAANRIRTGTGGNLNFTNNPVILRAIYDANASRWRLLDGAPYR